ncbi:FOL3 [Candida oxycetoniae]|uniref:Dihydrofolate synthetase n=1 Tax=Candida oxycetoniae TaxID=497107 RepID=A0AAI9SXU1_9ASCO|nr:FOL3 [Candida oxycetoniae]KAI3404775.2 FOL3 [Candida oxycetoniae]
MPIDLGLARITKLLAHLNNPHLSYKSIHIAGTNGKGSTLAYLSSILTQSRIRNGKFTSPHMVEINDCICINNEVYPRSKFDIINSKVTQINEELELKCTEFEILTVTALRIFELERVELALIEVGVGGRLDATNVLTAFHKKTGQPTGGVVATGITMIGMDHEKLLGNTIEKIAWEKAGIMKQDIPCFVDSSNGESVLNILREKSRSVSCPMHVVTPSAMDRNMIQYSPLRGDYQINNLALALRILSSLSAYHHVDHHPYAFSTEKIISGIKNTNWPGRLQSIKVKGLKEMQVLIDGAHNESSAIELGKYLRKNYLEQDILFVIGVTRGKNLDNIMKHLIRKPGNDVVVPSLFSQPDRMPWIHCESVQKIKKVAEKYCNVELALENAYIDDVFEYLRERNKTKSGTVVVICGSLYLCGDVLRSVSIE